MGFVWMYKQIPISPGRIRLMTTVVRYLNSDPEASCYWDEELRMSYLNGPHAGEQVRCFRESTDGLRELLLFLEELEMGTLVVVYKAARIAMYHCYDGTSLHILKDDCTESVQRYLEEQHTPNWLLQQERTGEL